VTGINLRNSSGSIVQNVTIAANLFGVGLESSSDNYINKNNISDPGWDGIFLSSSMNNSISENRIIASSAYGVYVLDSSYNSLTENEITDSGLSGMFLTVSTGNILSDNYLANNGLGINLGMSSSNRLRNNTMVNCSCSFGVASGNLQDFLNDVDTSNIVDGKQIYYWIDKQDMTVPTDAAYVALINCTNMTVRDLELERNAQGIVLISTSNSTIIRNRIRANCVDGILLYQSSNNVIRENDVADCEHNICLAFSSNNLLVANTVKGYNNNYIGINLGGSSNNSIVGNTLTANYISIYVASDWHYQPAGTSNYNVICENVITSARNSGIFLSGGSYNIIAENCIAKNTPHGIFFALSSDNKIYHNIFKNNLRQVCDLFWDGDPTFGSVNVWNQDYPSGGNYWSDYDGMDLYSGIYQNETGSDGIGDTAYTIDENNTDRYPLIRSHAFFGDVNFDGKVDLSDAAQMKAAFGTHPGEPEWNGLTDLNHDEITDILDAILFAHNFGRKRDIPI
jgi:parallel beta-helix repeat protein